MASKNTVVIAIRAPLALADAIREDARGRKVSVNARLLKVLDAWYQREPEVHDRNQKDHILNDNHIELED
jgi:hypothetical protein